MAIGFGIASRNWWRAQLKGGLFPSFRLNFDTIGTDFTFTRNSFATRVNEFGLIETVTNLGSDVVQNGSFDELGSELIENGDFDELGSERVVNGDFATDSDWLKSNSTISDGKGNLDSTSSSSILFQQNTLIVGKTYKANFDVSNYNGLGTCALINSSGVTQFEITSDGNKDFYFTHGGSSANLTFRATVGGIFSIDNVSVKQVDPNDDWSVGSDSEINNGSARIYSPSGGYTFVSQSSVLTIGKTYLISLEIVEQNAGEIRLSDGSGYLSPSFSGVGLHTFTSASLGTILRIQRTTSITDIRIDNVSVKQVDPNDDWSFTNVGGSNGWRIADSRAICDTVNPLSGRNLDSVSVLTSGKTYKLTLDILQSADGMRVFVGNTALPTFLPTGTNLGYEYTINGADHTGGIFRLYAGSSDLQEIDNVVIQEVIEDDIPRIDYTGSTFDVPVLGDELVTNGNFSTDTDWTKDSGWSIADGKATYDGLSNIKFIKQNGVLANNSIDKEYNISFEILDSAFTIGLTSGSNLFKDENGVNIKSEFAIGVHSVKAFSSNSLTDFRIYGYTDSGNGGSIDNVSVKEVTAYTTTDKGAFLLEPISTNLITYSEDISGSSNWGASSVATTINVTTSPDGTQNADLIQSIGSSSCFLFDNTLTFTVGNTYSFSVFAKKGNNDWIRTAHVSSATNASWFDLENGVVGTVNGVSGTIEDYGNGWYKCTNTFVATQSSGGNQVFIGICDSDGSTNSGVDGQNNYVWGMQVEELSYATSYIPTSGTTVTRAQESCVGATPTINSEEGVLYAEISALVDDSTRRSISLSNGSASNRVMLRYDAVSNRIQCFTQIGGTVYADISTTSYDTTDINKIAYRYKSGEYALYVNGVEQGTSTDATVFPQDTLTELSFRRGDNNASQDFYGRTKDLRVYDKALTDSELTELTTI